MSETYNNMEKTPEEQVEYPYSVPVRFKDAAKPYSFGTFDKDIKKGQWVVVETAQGLEMGEAEADAVEISKYNLRMPQKPIIRVATSYDLRCYEENSTYEDEAFDICNEEITALGLDMNLLNAQYTLDRSKVLFIYLADQRVDFRELLKKLGARLHCRIELRQIGERDKAKMVGGIGMCGMECYCRRFKNRFDIISINMAKNQLLALNIEKVSGMCGKLMCCLKYEDEDYKELTAGLPKMGSQVEYEGNIYRITNMNVMNEEAKLENHEQVIFITLQDLRDKAIPRKGVVMQRRNDGEKKEVIHRNVVRTAEKPAPKVSMELPTMNVKTERRENTRGNNNNNQNQNRGRNNGNAQANASGNPAGNNNHNAHRNRRRNDRNRDRDRSQEKTTETRNVTVRTFGRKKTQENQG